MSKRISIIVSFVVGLLSFISPAAIFAAPVVATDSVPAHKSVVEESLLPAGGRNLFFSHFTWGAELGSTIDLTGHDLSSFDLDVLFGYKNDILKLAGVGVGVHRSFYSGATQIPVYGTIRTSFRPKPSLLFMDIAAGYQFDTRKDIKTFGDFMCSLGLGVNFSQSQRAKSYMILSAGYRYFNENHKATVQLDTQYIYVVRLVFGVNF